MLFAAGRWTPNKGEEVLVPLIAALPDREVVVSPHGLDADARRAIGATGNVWFMDAPIERLLDGAGVCLVPSQSPEPFSRVAFEAQAAGIPVLASAVGGLPEIVPEPAVLPAYAPPAAWAAAVRSLEDPDAWTTAHRRAQAAAAEVVASRPLERAAAIVERAADGG